MSREQRLIFLVTLISGIMACLGYIVKASWEKWALLGFLASGIAEILLENQKLLSGTRSSVMTPRFSMADSRKFVAFFVALTIQYWFFPSDRVTMFGYASCIYMALVVLDALTKIRRKRLNDHL